MRISLFYILAFIGLNNAFCQPQPQLKFSEDIRLNQIGFYPDAPKIAVTLGVSEGLFFISSPCLTDTLFKGRLGSERSAQYSSKSTRIADFSEFKKPGTYVLWVPQIGYSSQFSIKEKVHSELATAAIKSYYYQRTLIPLTLEFAGKWSRPAGHPDDKVLVHGSAATKKRPEGTVISAQRGWYDAGDYNKYIVNSGITMGTMLSFHEDFEKFSKQWKIDIPESGNGVPDLLNELIWNLRWMLTMQDPNDGGVYHKLTTANFEGAVMPAEARNTRYVVQKGTAASLDFAAVTAQAARILKNYNSQLPGLADSCLNASVKAWKWARKNPDILYKQDELNKNFKPTIATGAYGDGDVSDEFIWAAAELYVTTGDDTYYKSVNLFPDANTPLPAWPQVRTLAYYTLMRFADQLTPQGKKDIPSLKARLLAFAEGMLAGADTHSYHTVMGKNAGDFIWGSSSVAANQGIGLIRAYSISGERKYLDFALHNLDYLLGRNGTTYSYVTGFGHKTPMHIHHRPSEADGVPDPVPGLLSGGPNPGMQDGCDYPSAIPDEAFVDDWCSYASNEITINWNAPLVYLVAALEALQYEAGYSSK